MTMTKIFMTTIVALLTISSFSACNRTYRCSCVTTIMVNDSTVSSTTITKELRTTKADARNKCSSWSQHTVTGADTTHTAAECSFR
jgi:hypothetical protein